MSLTNLSSTGQLAGVNILAELFRSPDLAIIGLYTELAIALLIINLRYLLMSFSLANKLDPRLSTLRRMVIGFGVTDEIYAVASQEKGQLNHVFFFGLMTLPILGWTSGTLCGALLGPILPPLIANAFNIAIYCMFIAIIVPPARDDRTVFKIIVLAIALNVLFLYLPYFRDLAVGWRLIIVTILAAGTGALLAPKEVSDES